ncbi:hypothetical protein MAR_018664 [Mya arenaria]|uniref:Uncharacterized protein n=1 Tax=Mya arenaria TaxID=6604 RepID=A0ABY7EIS0_MYAAR|nr:hypothetical protein MAR_018664 [Mya arenaria]
MATNELNDNDYNGVKRGSHSTQEGKSGAQSLIKDKIPEDSGMRNKTLASAKEALMEFGYDFTDDEVNEAYNQLKRTNDIKKYKGVADKLIPIMEAKREEKLPEIIASGQRKINARS